MEEFNINQDNVNHQISGNNNIQDISSLYNDEKNSPNSIISVKEWLLTFIILGIPVIGLIMLFVWAFGNDSNETKSNWAKAHLIFILIMFIISITFIVLFGISMFSMMGNFR